MFRRTLKHVKWLANKRELENVVLHSFTHLGAANSSPDFAEAFLNELAERLRAAVEANVIMKMGPILASALICRSTLAFVVPSNIRHASSRLLSVSIQAEVNSGVSRLETLQTLLSEHGAPGSVGCNAKGDLSFSWRLILAPEPVLDYVAAHEVAHLREHNHSKAFWRLVEQLRPDYRDGEKWLKRFGSELHRYG